MTIYQISGLGAGVEVFQTINLDYPTVFIPWIDPTPNETIESYAKRMAKDINTTEPFALMGVSFGGIMIQEISRFLNPEKLFVISSVQHRYEIPIYMRFLAKTGLTKKIPKTGIKKTKKAAYFLFGAKRKKEQDFIGQILDSIKIDYIRWGLTQIGNWKGAILKQTVIRFHGKDDLIFPSKNLKNINHWLKGGHLASNTDGRTISNFVNKELEKIS